MIIKYLSLSLLIVHIFSCDITELSTGSPSVPNDTPYPPPDPTRVDVLRILIGGALHEKLEQKLMNAAEAINRFYAKNSDKRANHVIFDRANEEWYQDISDNHAFKHNATETQLTTEILPLIKQYWPQKLVFAFRSHGDSKGNLCYRTTGSCTLSANDIVKLLIKIDDENLLKPKDKQLKNILIHSVSCHNKLLSDDILTGLHTHKKTSFSLSILHLSANEFCYFDAAIPMLFSGRLYYKLARLSFLDWANIPGNLKKFTTLSTFEELCVLKNEIYPLNLLSVSYSDGNTPRDNILSHYQFMPSILRVGFQQIPAGTANLDDAKSAVLPPSFLNKASVLTDLSFPLSSPKSIALEIDLE